MYFVLPLFGQAPGVIEDTSTFIVVNLFSVLTVLLFVRWLKYDFVKLRTDHLVFEDQRVLYLGNWTMVIYYLSMQSLTYLEAEKGISTLLFRQLILVGCLVVFMGIIKQLDLHLRQKLQEKLAFQQNMQLRDLENYSNHIEELIKR